MADIGRAYGAAGNDVKDVLKLCAPDLFAALESLARVVEQAKDDAPGCAGGSGTRCGPPAARIGSPDGPIACVYHAAGRAVYPLGREEK